MNTNLRNVKSHDHGKGRVFLFTLFWAYAVLTRKSDEGILLTLPLFFIILVQVRLIKEAHFSLMDMTWLCLLIFFVVAPLQSLNQGFFDNAGAVSKIHFSDWDLFKSMSVAIVATLSFVFGSFVAKSFLPSKTVRGSALEDIRISGRVAFQLALLSVCASVAYIYFSGGISNVLASRHLKVDQGVNILAPFFLAFHTVTNAIIAVGFRNCEKKERNALIVCLVISSLLLLILLNPFNSSRFILISSWLPLVICLYSNRLKYLSVYAILLLGLIIVMPVMSLTTRLGLEGAGQFEDSNYSSEIFMIKDIDVYDTLTHGVKMADAQPYYMGKNISAIVLFFVPRALWVDKPIVGGLVVGNDLLRFKAGTANLSYYIGGDFYMDFGYLGVVIGFVVIGLFLQVFFVRLRRSISLEEIFLLASTPILMRGPVGAVVGYFVCLYVSLRIYSLALQLSVPRRTTSLSSPNGLVNQHKWSRL